MDEGLAISLGNFAQRIRASLVRPKRNGIQQYTDPNGARGPLKKLVLNTQKGTLSIQVKGTATGVETTNPNYIPVAMEAGDLYLSARVSGVSKGIKFKP